MRTLVLQTNPSKEKTADQMDDNLIDRSKNEFEGVVLFADVEARTADPELSAAVLDEESRANIAALDQQAKPQPSKDARGGPIS